MSNAPSGSLLPPVAEAIEPGGKIDAPAAHRQPGAAADLGDFDAVEGKRGAERRRGDPHLDHHVAGARALGVAAAAERERHLPALRVDAEVRAERLRRDRALSLVRSLEELLGPDGICAAAGSEQRQRADEHDEGAQRSHAP
ncbi:MAG: hypothetical protein ACYDA3_03975 [Gaiellaceae bacterium]